jgi:hypothetical protein
MEKHFDADRIVSIHITELRESRHKWLPRKQKTWFFGLLKRNSWYSEGYYESGHYMECYESGCWDAHAHSAKGLRDCGYIVDESTKTVYNKPHVAVHLEHKLSVSRSFDSNTEAYAWVSDLRKKSGKNFETVTY